MQSRDMSQQQLVTCLLSRARERDRAANKQPCLNYSQFILPQLLSYSMTGRPTQPFISFSCGANSQIRMRHYHKADRQTGPAWDSILFSNVRINTSIVILYHAHQIRSRSPSISSPRTSKSIIRNGSAAAAAAPQYISCLVFCPHWILLRLHPCKILGEILASQQTLKPVWFDQATRRWREILCKLLWRRGAKASRPFFRCCSWHGWSLCLLDRRRPWTDQCHIMFHTIRVSRAKSMPSRLNYKRGQESSSNNNPATLSVSAGPRGLCILNSNRFNDGLFTMPCQPPGYYIIYCAMPTRF